MSELKPCEAIEILESIYPSKKQIVTGEYPDVAEALDMAIVTLRRAQSNEPLTLEQLRGMDGEPVWLKDGIGEGWFLAGAVVGSKIYFCEKSITIGEPISGCGKNWLAYRRKPEPEGKIEK